MKFSRMNIFAALIFATGLVTSGCTGDSNVKLTPHVRPPVADIAVPIGFSIVLDKSKDRMENNLRWVDHLYSGSSDQFAVANFYEKQMPISRWELLNKGFAQGRSTLDFKKGSEHCRVTIYRHGIIPQTYIHIALWPGK